MGQANSSCTHLVPTSLHPPSHFLCLYLLILSSRKAVPRQQSITHWHSVRFALLCNQVSRAKRCEIAYCFVNQICVLVLILVSGAKPARTVFLHNTESMEHANMHMAANKKHSKPKQKTGTHCRLSTFKELKLAFSLWHTYSIVWTYTFPIFQHILFDKGDFSHEVQFI